MITYTVSVTTGNQEFAGTIDYVYLTLVGTERRSDRTLLDKSFFDRFARGAVRLVFSPHKCNSYVMYLMNEITYK